MKKFSNEKIIGLIRKKELEDMRAIEAVELLLKRKRGYVFKMPQRQSAVVFQFSGGVDSVTTAAYLMEKHKVTLYPIFLRRGQSRVKQEEGSVNYYSQIFSKKYPLLFNPVFKMETSLPPLEIRSQIIKVSNNKLNVKSERRLGIPMFASLLTAYAVQYAYYLELTKNITVRTILCAAIADDGIQMAHHTLTGLRGIMLDICTQTNDYRWQFTSPWIEKNMGHYHGKEHVIDWGVKHGLILDKTWSCYKNGKLHCGACINCVSRKQAFWKAHLQDSTVYAKSSIHNKNRGFPLFNLMRKFIK